MIVIVLSTLIYVYNVVMKPFYVILLALLNDLSMIPISSDNAKAAAIPEIPSMPQILLAAMIYGLLLTTASLSYFEALKYDGSIFISSDVPSDKICDPGPGNCDYIQTCLYLQISIAVEFVILSCRCPGFILAPAYTMCGDGRPSLALCCGIAFANVLVCTLAWTGFPSGTFTQVKIEDILLIWAYDIVVIIIIDAIKVALSFAGTPFMSAGAAGGSLEYPDLPITTTAGSIARTGARSVMSEANRSLNGSVRIANNNGSVRSAAAANRSIHGSMNQSLGGNGGSVRSNSLLPFPYNLRANNAA
jgi:H+-transporting ATPase